MVGVGTSAQRGTRVRDVLRHLSRTHACLTSAHLELTKRCNLRCYHCYVSGDMIELDTARWLGVVDELAAEGCMQVSITGGELTLRSDWLEIAGQVKKRRMTLTILTNGTLLGAEATEDVARLKPVLVAVSLYGANAVAHERVTGVRGSFDRSLRALVALRSAGIRCQVSCTLMPTTLPGFRGIVDLATELGCDYSFNPTVFPKADGDANTSVTSLPPEKLLDFFLDERILSKSRVGALGRLGSDPDAKPTNCGAGMNTLTIEANGDAVPCFGLRPEFGNVACASVQEVWTSARADEHRTRMRAPLSDCEPCRLRGMCTARCPRLALAEHDSVSARSSRACELASMNEQLRARVVSLQAASGEWYQ